MAQTQNLHTRAVLVNLSISSWSARKFDKQITKETLQAHGASEDAGRWNKNLMPGDATSYKDLVKHLAATREENYAQTLAWADKGFRLLPTKNGNNIVDKVA